MKRILITGGTGFIGSHTAVKLIENGYKVVIIDNLSNSYIEVLDGIENITSVRPEFECFDLRDRQKVLAFFEKQEKFDAVIHFSAHKAVGESMQQPHKYYSNNVISMINIIEGMEETGVENIVFSSSSTVYGIPDKFPVSEKSEIKPPMSPYGHTKQICESLITSQAEAKKIKGIILRFFNPIGAHSSAMIGEYPIGNPNNLVPFITQTAIGKREMLNVFGNDYKTKDGTCIRDYIYIEDLAEAHNLSLSRLLNDDNNKEDVEVFNLGSGEGFSVLEIIETFEKVSKLKLNYKFVDRREGDIDIAYSDTTKAREILGWKAQTSLDDMLLSAWKWEQYLAKLKK